MGPIRAKYMHPIAALLIPCSVHEKLRGVNMEVLTSLAISLAVSLDGFLVGVVYGVGGIRLNWIPRALIAATSALLVWLSMTAGILVGRLLGPVAGQVLGGTILVGVGVWALAHAVNRSALVLEVKHLGLVIRVLKDPQMADSDMSGEISVAESVILGLALALDALGAGFGIGVSGTASVILPLAVGIFMAISLSLGLGLGGRFKLNQAVGSLAVLPGVILAFMGFSRVLGALFPW